MRRVYSSLALSNCCTPPPVLSRYLGASDPPRPYPGPHPPPRFCIRSLSSSSCLTSTLRSAAATFPPPTAWVVYFSRRPLLPQVLELFQSLGLHSTRSNRNLSTSDLKGMGRGRIPTASGAGIRRNPLATSLDGSGMRAALGPTARHPGSDVRSPARTNERSGEGAPVAPAPRAGGGGVGLPTTTGGVHTAGLGMLSRAVPEPPRLASIASSPPPAERAPLGAEGAEPREPVSTFAVRLS
jgi:hypothetical protein